MTIADKGKGNFGVNSFFFRFFTCFAPFTARPLRIEFPGALYHLTAPGQHQEARLFDDQDRTIFQQVLQKNLSDCIVICHAYCLMTTHYHLLLETPEGNLSQIMKQIIRIIERFEDQESKRFPWQR